MSNRDSSRQVVVIGAGASGLVAAYALRKRGVDAIVLESSLRVGGSVESVKMGGYLCEMGPNTLMLSSREVESFLEDLSLLSQALTPAALASKRYVVDQYHRPVALPSGLVTALSTRVLTPSEKCRVFRELFSLPGIDPDESIHAFFSRHFGQGVARELVGPFVSGIYAGDPERLLIRHAFPRLWEMDQKHGSIFRSLFKKKKSKLPKVERRLISWPEGLQTLTDTLYEKIGVENVLIGSDDISIQKEDSGIFQVFHQGGQIAAPKVILTTPVPMMRKVLSGLCGGDSGLPPLIPSVPMVVVHLGFERGQIAHPLDGFGVLIRRGLGFRLLGTLFSSSLFEGRTPPGRVLLTAFLGGRMDPDSIQLSDREVRETVLDELTKLLQISGSEEFINIKRWPQAIPQYEADYDKFLTGVDHLEKAHPGLHISGNSRGGISMPQCIENNLQLAMKLFP